MKSTFLAVILVGCAGCASPGGHDPAGVPLEPSPIDVSAWTPETITLPPGFAPGLPSGTERILFAPGMKDVTSEELWCYAFVMDVNEAEIGPGRIADILDQYFDGLMAVFGEGRPELDVPSDPAKVSLSATGSSAWRGSIELFDAYVTGMPMVLNTVVDASELSESETRLRFRMSPLPYEHVGWKALDAAVEAIEGE